MNKSNRERKLGLMVIPDGPRESRTVYVSYRVLGALAAISVVMAIGLVIVVGSWSYFAARALRATSLEAEVEAMAGDRVRLQILGQRLEIIEEQYGRMRDLLGYASSDELSNVWLPPPTGARRAGTRGVQAKDGPTLPSVWPLTVRGFVTQGLHEGLEGEHPGLDVAVASNSYIRASGGGIVSDVGEDAVYGHFVVIDHGQGYSTLYGHASVTLVGLGQQVREREVIALSGSTGRSTGPHLHFEVLVDGRHVDPLTLVQQPN